MSPEQTVRRAAHSLQGLARERHIARILAKARAWDTEPPAAPSGPQLEPPKTSSGPSPVVVIGAALVAGYALAKVISWRSRVGARA
jgi:hypothetical protein